jgi:hypothetical protein
VRGKLVLGLILCAALVAPNASAAAVFTNATPVQNTDPLVGDAGPLIPYPSVIDVNDLPGTVTGVRVTLHGIAFSNVQALETLLMGPTGARTMLVNNRCIGQDSNGNPLTFTIDDSAAGTVPQTGPCVSGTYKPTNTSGSVFQSPVPPPPQPVSMSVFAGTEPNGLWQLFGEDTVVSGDGAITGGWTLELTTTGTPAVKKKCKGKKKHRASAAKKKRCKKKHH